MGKRWISIKDWHKSRLFNVGGDQYRMTREKKATITFRSGSQDGAIQLCRQINMVASTGRVQGRLV